MIPTTKSDEAADSKLALLRFTSVIFAALLLFFSWPLWLQSGDLYPQVPLFSFARTASYTWDLVALAIAAASIAMLLVPSRRWQAAGCCGFILGSVALVVLDQHRLQPWLQQLILLCLFALLLPRSLFLNFARWLLISIYLFSAASKFDFVFLQSLGHQFSDQAFSFVGIDFKVLPDPIRWCCAWSFPIGELLIGVGLMMPKTRRLAAWLAIILHVFLLLILGPLGLNHQAGVLCWNLFFVAQVVILFLLPDRMPTQEKAGEGRTSEPIETIPKAGIAHALCRLLLILPVLEPFGYYDHWPAWQLYAPRNSRVAMSILDERVDKLPDSLLPYVSEPGGEFGIWREIDLSGWSLETLHVPIYPHGRFQIGVSLATIEKYDLTSVRIDVQETADRSTGERQQQVFSQVPELKEMASERFRLNAMPRDLSARLARP